MVTKKWRTIGVEGFYTIDIPVDAKDADVDVSCIKVELPTKPTTELFIDNLSFEMGDPADRRQALGGIIEDFIEGLREKGDPIGNVACQDLSRGPRIVLQALVPIGNPSTVPDDKKVSGRFSKRR